MLWLIAHAQGWKKVGRDVPHGWHCCCTASRCSRHAHCRSARSDALQEAGTHAQAAGGLTDCLPGAAAAVHRGARVGGGQPQQHLFPALAHAACQPPPSCTLPPPASCFPCGVPTQLLSPSRCPPTPRQVRTSSAVFEDFGFGPGVRPALAGFLLFQQLIGPADEVRAGGGRLGCVQMRQGRMGTACTTAATREAASPMACPTLRPAGAGPAV